VGKKIKVLSIDAGGIRGIIAAIILAELEAKTRMPISSMFDLISGTSTGGILAAGLTVPDQNGQPKFSAQNLVDFYTNRTHLIFKKSTTHKIFPFLDYFRPKYPKDGIENELNTLIGDAKLSDSLTELLIPSYEIENRETVFFKSRKVKTNDQEDFYMKDVIRATSAAPSFFPIAKITPIGRSNNKYFIDGATFASDPAMCAYVETKNMHNDIDEMVLLSLGAGNYSQPIPYKKAKNWGMLFWTTPLLSVLFDGMPDTVEYQIGKIFTETNDKMKFFRLQPELSAENEIIDNASKKNIESLVTLTNRYIKENEEVLNKVCASLLED